MRYTVLLYLILPIILVSTVVHATEVEDVLKRIASTGYPIPESIIRDMHNIEQELTPLPVMVKPEVTLTRKGWYCDIDVIEIPYQINPQRPVSYFTVELVRPSERIKKRYFPNATQYPTVIIQPTINGPTILERQISRDLCKRGMTSIMPLEILIHLPEKLPDFDVYNRYIRTEIIRTRRMVDYLNSRSDILVDNIGLIGFSRGAIVGAIVLGIEPRVRFAYLGAGGVGVGQIIANSTNRHGRKESDRHRRAAGMTEEEFEEKLIQTVRYDGILFSHRVNPENLKLMVVTNDTSVATENQKLLEESFGKPETDYVGQGHTGSIIYRVFVAKGAYLDFFERKLKELEETNL